MGLFGRHLHRCENPMAEAPPWALEQFALGLVILEKLETIMATLDQVLADVTSESTRLDSIAALISGLQQQVADALAGVTLPPAVQAKIDAVFAGTEANSAKIDKALNTGVPPPVVTPAP